MRSIKLFLVLLLLVALVLPSTSLFGQEEEIELQMTWWGSQTRHDKTIEVIEMFEAEHPNIHIVYEFANFNDYWTLLNTKASSDALPDIMQHDYAFLQDWVARDLLMPLDPFIESGAINTADIPEGLLAPGIINGQNYALSLGVNSQSIIIDTDAFAEAGIELPSADWTWTEFEETVMALHESLGKWGFGSLLTDEAMWKSLQIGHGGWAFNEEGTAIGYEDDQPTIDYLDMILRLQDAEAIPTIADEVELENAGPEASPIVTGDSAMQYQWSNQVIAVTNAAGEGRNFKLWHLPRPDGGVSQNYLKPSMFFTIPATSEHPEEAAMFIDFFTNSMEANEILAAERGVPVSTVVRDHLLPLVTPVMQETFDFLSRVEADSSPVPPPDPVGWAEIRDNVYDPLVIEPVRYGELEPAEALQLLREEANRILAQNN
jgi:multiple sugar transport system substrate-binding protein